LRELGEREGNEKLFWHNQFQVATYRQKCCNTSLTGEFEHFVEWKDPYPYTLAEIETEGGEAVNSQQVLVQGMLNRRFEDVFKCIISLMDMELVIRSRKILKRTLQNVTKCIQEQELSRSSLV
jgi:hypothetical protein